MERIKLNLLEQFSFSTEIKIRITDLNYGGHVGNDTFLSLIHEARQQFFMEHELAELQFAGVGVIMADIAVEYKKELSHQDNVKISVAATGFEKYGFDLHYLVEVEEDGKYVVAAKVKSGMLCYDYSKKKLMRVPAEAVEKLNRYQLQHELA